MGTDRGESRYKRVVGTIQNAVLVAVFCVAAGYVLWVIGAAGPLAFGLPGLLLIAVIAVLVWRGARSGK